MKEEIYSIEKPWEKYNFYWQFSQAKKAYALCWICAFLNAQKFINSYSFPHLLPQMVLRH